MLFRDKARATIREHLSAVQLHLRTAEDRIAQWRELILWASLGEPFDAWMNRSAELAGAAPLERVPGPIPLVASPQMQWSSLEEQRSWAADTLIGVTTAAVDGSHMAVSDTFDLEMAVIQVAWFVNRHLPRGSFEKKVEFRILFSEDTVPGDERLGPNYTLERFTHEMNKAKDLVEKLAGLDPPPVVFIDGTIIPSFAELATPEEKRRFVEPSVELLAASEKARVPIVAYIDRSWARDVVEALSALSGMKPKAPPVSDAQVLSGILSHIGERTAAFRCQRQGILQSFNYRGQDYSREVAFLYMRVNSGLPVRIEFPAWIVRHQAIPGRGDDHSLVQYLADVVLAEAIVGNGYPWPLATADAAAALTAQDRALFLQILQEEAARAGIGLGLPRKAVSKYQRRVW